MTQKKMRIQLNKYVWIVLLINIWGCAYESNIPISNSEESNISELILGDWIGINGDSTMLFPDVEINLQAFNKKEYVAILKFYNKTGRRLSSVNTYKVFNSIVGNFTYLNVKDLNPLNDDYIFCRIEQVCSDSIQLRYLTDTLTQKFSTSNQLRMYLEQHEKDIEGFVLSSSHVLYRWHSIVWDKVNLKETTDNFENFYLLGKLDEEWFLKLEGQDLKNFVAQKEKIPIDKVKTHFSKVSLIRYGLTFWKVPNYALIQLRNKKFIKLKIDMVSGVIEDLTNGRKYRNMNKKRWKF